MTSTGNLDVTVAWLPLSLPAIEGRLHVISLQDAGFTPSDGVNEEAADLPSARRRRERSS
jgi:hypothetical protein